MTAAELVIGKRYMLGFGPVDARQWNVGTYFEERAITNRPVEYRFVIKGGEWDGSFFGTTNPERDVRPMEE